MKTKTKYTLIPLPGLAREPFLRRSLDSSEQWQIHLHPYQTLPPLECHIAPPFVIINGGPKCTGANLDVISWACCQMSKNQQALKDWLELLSETWSRFENAMANAKDWEMEKRSKRKREHNNKDIERLSQSRQRTTQSQSRSLPGSAGRNSSPACRGRCRGSRTNIGQMQASGTHKWNWTHSSSGATLSKYTVSHLGKQQKI